MDRVILSRQRDPLKHRHPALVAIDSRYPFCLFHAQQSLGNAAWYDPSWNMELLYTSGTGSHYIVLISSSLIHSGGKESLTSRLCEEFMRTWWKCTSMDVHGTLEALKQLLHNHQHGALQGSLQISRKASKPLSAIAQKAKCPVRNGDSMLVWPASAHKCLVTTPEGFLRKCGFQCQNNAHYFSLTGIWDPFDVNNHQFCRPNYWICNGVSFTNSKPDMM